MVSFAGTVNQYDEAHDREQASAGLLEAINILRRLGPGCVVCVMTSKGRVYRQISASNATVQTELMALTARKLNENLTTLAMEAAKVVDEHNPPGYLDDIRRALEEDDDS